MSDFIEEPDIIELDRHRMLPERSRVICYFTKLDSWPVLMTIQNGRLPIGGDRPLPIDLITRARIERDVEAEGAR